MYHVLMRSARLLGSFLSLFVPVQAWAQDAAGRKIVGVSLSTIFVIFDAVVAIAVILWIIKKFRASRSKAPPRDENMIK